MDAKAFDMWPTSLCKDSGACLEPNSLLELNTILCQQLGDDAPQGTKHGPSCMNDFNFPVPAVERVARQNQGPDQPMNDENHSAVEEDLLWKPGCAGMTNHLANVAGSAERPAVSQP